MNFRIILSSITLISILLFTNYSEKKHSKTIDEFNDIETAPEIISFTNKFEINNIGGHLQGIQHYENETETYFFMSGSSDLYSYLTVVKSGDENQLISLNNLMEKPFKHAGGCQVFKNYLAVGIEDNSAKDKAKVCIYDISEPEKPFAEPITVIERNGEPLRSTAGCVGMTNYKNEVLVVIGDWDTKHIDFYSSEFSKMADNGFKKIGSVDTENVSKTGWINTDWNSYQNINLFNIKGNLFLVGLGQDSQSENIADLFQVSEESPGNFLFKKVAAKTFNCTNECSFKAAAGVEYENGEFKIFACGYHTESTSFLNIFRKN